MTLTATVAPVESGSLLKAISADSHITEPGDCYLPFIDPAYRDRAPVARHARRDGCGDVDRQRPLA